VVNARWLLSAAFLLLGCSEVVTGLPCADDDHCRVGEQCRIDVGDSVGVCGSPVAPPVWAAVAAGASHSCALDTDGRATCWGRNEYGQASPPDVALQAISAGAQFTCGLRLDGTPICWGRDLEGRTDAPIRVFEELVLGGGHACGSTGSDLDCWGRGVEGQTQAPDRSLTGLDAHGVETCGLTPAGGIECWGLAQEFPDLPAADAVDVAVGDTFVCWSDGGPVQCTGGTFTEWLTPPAVTLTDLDAGEVYVCGITDGRVHCFGSTGQWEDEPEPLRAVDADAVALSVGAGHGCVLFDDGTITCFGDNTSGQSLAP